MELPPFEYPNPRSICVYAGTDEVGRGPLVGDVVAAAVILDPNNPIEGLNDSKKLSEKKRLKLFSEILEKALSIGIGRASPEEIDNINILWASMLAMERAVNNLLIKPDMVLVDGNKVPKNLGIPALAVVKGDARVSEISAASIVAKVTRDQELIELDKQYPMYGFACHKGYPTASHLEAIKKYGILPIYRKSYAPVKAIIEQELCFKKQCSKNDNQPRQCDLFE
ncbi:MAG: ribonuclease HII [Succinivibrionaceae bacterium]